MYIFYMSVKSLSDFGINFSVAIAVKIWNAKLGLLLDRVTKGVCETHLLVKTFANNLP
jgi:hypothetical protein